ncbi:hypothetical protein KSP40_PGU013931 [Platanthera guangdongensis]|uniref:Uncharacterized protein n=1 Tax=Platanthera guangdongensis TaxID=2320717 RepID=A0ABR2LKR1_9ASPA
MLDQLTVHKKCCSLCDSTPASIFPRSNDALTACKPPCVTVADMQYYYDMDIFGCRDLRVAGPLSHWDTIEVGLMSRGAQALPIYALRAGEFGRRYRHFSQWRFIFLNTFSPKLALDRISGTTTSSSLWKDRKMLPSFFDSVHEEINFCFWPGESGRSGPLTQAAGAGMDWALASRHSPLAPCPCGKCSMELGTRHSFPSYGFLFNAFLYRLHLDSSGFIPPAGDLSRDLANVQKSPLSGGARTPTPGVRCPHIPSLPQTGSGKSLLLPLSDPFGGQSSFSSRHPSVAYFTVNACFMTGSRYISPTKNALPTVNKRGGLDLMLAQSAAAACIDDLKAPTTGSDKKKKRADPERECSTRDHRLLGPQSNRSSWPPRRLFQRASCCLW